MLLFIGVWKIIFQMRLISAKLKHEHYFNWFKQNIFLESKFINLYWRQWIIHWQTYYVTESITCTSTMVLFNYIIIQVYSPPTLPHPTTPNKLFLYNVCSCNRPITQRTKGSHAIKRDQQQQQTPRGYPQYESLYKLTLLFLHPIAAHSGEPREPRYLRIEKANSILPFFAPYA